MFAADAEFEILAHLAAAFGGNTNQFADAVAIDRNERIARQDALGRVDVEKAAASSRLMPNAVWVKSLVPNEKNSAVCAISPANSAARGSSIMVPTWYFSLRFAFGGDRLRHGVDALLDQSRARLCWRSAAP